MVAPFGGLRGVLTSVSYLVNDEVKVMFKDQKLLPVFEDAFTLEKGNVVFP